MARRGNQIPKLTPKIGDRILAKTETVDRKKLIELLNDDLAREYQAIIAYTVYSQVLKGAEYMNIAKELEKHAGEELAACAENRQPDRLSRRHADRDAQAGQDLGKGRRHAAVRPGKRKGNHRQLPHADQARPTRWASMR